MMGAGSQAVISKLFLHGDPGIGLCEEIVLAVLSEVRRKARLGMDCLRSHGRQQQVMSNSYT